MKNKLYVGAIVLFTCISFASANEINWHTYKELKSDADIDFTNVVDGTTYIASGGEEELFIKIAGKDFKIYNTASHQSKIAFEDVSLLTPYYYSTGTILPFKDTFANFNFLHSYAGSEQNVGSVTFTIKDLEVGKAYRVHFIAVANVPPYGLRYRDYTLDDNPTQFGMNYDHDGDGERNTSIVIGEFTADGTTQDFEVKSAYNEGVAYSGIILSEIDVPEPATMLLLAGGLAGLITRRRKKSA